MSKSAVNRSTERIEAGAKPMGFDQDVVFERYLGNEERAPRWRVRFDLASDTSQSFGLELDKDVALGRGTNTESAYSLGKFGADEEGVSREHAILRPTPTSLYIIDKNSTNGSQRNGQPLGPGTPYPLMNGDLINLGRLQFIVRIVERPSTGQTGYLRKKATLADALSQIGKAITTQLDLSEVMHQVAELSLAMTSAGEAIVWLMDELQGDLTLAAHYGIDDSESKMERMSLDAVDIIGQVMETGLPQRINSEVKGEQVKVKTGIMVDAALFVPIKLGDVPFGVLAATHRESGERFEERDELLLTAVADFAGIAIQNARLYKAVDKSLAQRVEDLTTLNMLSHAVSSTLDLNVVYEMLERRLKRLWPVERLNFWFYDESDNSVVPFKTDSGILGARLGPLVLKAIKDEAHMHEKRERPGKDSSFSLVVLPLYVLGQAIGAMALFTSRALDDSDVERMEFFTNPIATAIENAQLYDETYRARVEAEQARMVVDATANTIKQPLLILDDDGNVIISNNAANELLATQMGSTLMGLSQGVHKTTELEIGDKYYLATVENVQETGTIIVMQDITYVKQLEKDRAEFIKAITHDLKGPLTAIKGWTQLIEQVAEGNTVKKYVNSVITSSERMLGMINKLLEMIILSETVELNLKTTMLEPIVSNAISSLSGMAHAKDMTINFKRGDNQIQVLVDEDRIYHIAINLIENAIKYSPKKTTIIITTEYSEDGIYLRVEDEGPGVPKEEIPKLFEKGYRVRDTSELVEGAGLGLSIVQQMAGAHHGQIHASNRPEGGMRFTLVLPPANGPVAPQPAATPSDRVTTK